MLKISRGTVYDPANNIDGEVADIWIDPSQPKDRALVTHGHADHARGGHRAVWATPETLAIMDVRYGEQNAHPVALGETMSFGEVDVRFVPAGHVLGSAQIVLEHDGEIVVVSGDYKRRSDPTCPPFEPDVSKIFHSYGGTPASRAIDFTFLRSSLAEANRRSGFALGRAPVIA